MEDGLARWRFADARPEGWKLMGLSGWRDQRRTGHIMDDPATRHNGPFREIQLGRTARDGRACLMTDSVMVIDALVTPEECTTLRGAADAWCEQSAWNGEALRRIECHTRGINLDGETHALVHTILARALWNIECLEPALAAELFPRTRSRHLCDLQFEFSGREPMLNRYTTGGMFAPHQDSHALTILVPLSTPGTDFSGGGTAFWSESITVDSSVASNFPPSLVMTPVAGTALFWRGHVTHAGLPVKSGMRHVFVASFNLS